MIFPDTTDFSRVELQLRPRDPAQKWQKLKLHATKVSGVFIDKSEPGISVKLNLHAAEAGGVPAFDTRKSLLEKLVYCWVHLLKLT